MSAKLSQMREAALAAAKAMSAALRREWLEAAAWQRAIAYGPGGRHTEGGMRYLNVPGMGGAQLLSEVSDDVLRRLAEVRDGEEVFWVTEPEMVRGKVTLYRQSALGFGWRKKEASACFYQVRPVQDQMILELIFVRKGDRLRSYLTESSQPSLVILKGWGHPDLPSKSWGERYLSNPFVSPAKQQYPAFSMEWSREFGAALDAHVKKTGAQVLLDMRE